VLSRQRGTVRQFRCGHYMLWQTVPSTGSSDREGLSLTVDNGRVSVLLVSQCCCIVYVFNSQDHADSDEAGKTAKIIININHAQCGVCTHFKIFFLVGEILLPPQYGTHSLRHSRLFFTTYFPSTVSIRPSVPRIGSHECLITLH